MFRVGQGPIECNSELPGMDVVGIVPVTSTGDFHLVFAMQFVR